MENGYLTPLEIYLNKVFKVVIIIIPSIALCAGFTFTVLHIKGFYPDVNTTAIVAFDCTTVIYAIIGILFRLKCEDEEGLLKPNVLKWGKIFLAILIFIQWNFISYMIPSRDFWGYSFFFVLVATSLIDSKYTLVIIAEVVGSMAVSWFLRPNELLPVKDELYIPEMSLRGVLIILCFTTIWLLTAAIEKRLANELEKISDFDPLTMLYNRRKLAKYLDDAIEQRTAGGQFSVIMSDIDDFKKVNDTYGHACGDEVLKDVADIIRGSVENKCKAFRYGGEEMLVLVYGGEEEAVYIAEKIRKRIEEHITLFENTSVNVTLTLGVASYTEKDTKETMIKRADANLYYGKNHGKNCVIK